jgi:hypothetical protein
MLIATVTPVTSFSWSISWTDYDKIQRFSKELSLRFSHRILQFDNCKDFSKVACMLAVRHSSAHPLIHSSTQTVWQSDTHLLRWSDSQKVIHSSTQTVRQSDTHLLRQSDSHPLIHSDSQTVRQSDSHLLICWDSQTVRHSSAQTLRHSDTHSLIHSDSETVRHSYTQTHGHSDTWTLGHVNSWTVGQSDGPDGLRVWLSCCDCKHTCHFWKIFKIVKL